MDIYINKNVKPMLLEEIKVPFNNKDYLFEIKFDGIRAIIYVSKDEIIIKSRNGKILNDVYPELINIKNIVTKKCIFDGEIVLMENGKPSFSKLLERHLLKKRNKIIEYKENFPVTFVCFDILYENKNLMSLPLIKRKKMLDKYNDTDYFVKSRYINNEGIKLFNIVKKQKLEGMVAKLESSKYYPNKRSEEWLKIKTYKSEEFYICGYKEKGNVAVLILGEYKNNKYYYVGKVMLGKRKNDFDIIKNIKSVKNYLINFHELGCVFLSPDLKAIVRYLEKTKNNNLRHPVYVKLLKK